MIALSLSQRHSERIRSLILMDTAHRIGTPASWGERMAKVSADGIDAIADGVMKVWFSPAYHRTQPHDIAGWRTMLSRSPVEGYLAACGAISRADLEPAARALQVPTLCLVGSTDGSTPPELVRSLAAIVPGADFHEIPGPAHIPSIEAPQAVTDLITGHLAGIRGVADRVSMGMAVRRSVLGDAHVDRAEANKTAFDADFQAFITEGAWGSVWSRPYLTRRERSILTIGLLAALGHHEEVAMHVRAARNTGTTLEDIRDALLHVAVYAGVPAANTAIRIVKDTIAKEGAEGWSRRI
jgi:3-oxoadipate enol-lactonase/4-carboxymuconolactone decarboxylase